VLELAPLDKPSEGETQPYEFQIHMGFDKEQECSRDFFQPRLWEHVENRAWESGRGSDRLSLDQFFEYGLVLDSQRVPRETICDFPHPLWMVKIAD